MDTPQAVGRKLPGRHVPPQGAVAPPDFLQRLGLDRDCSLEDVRAAYLGLVDRVHPDHGGNKEGFQTLKQDYEQALSFVAARQRTAQPHNATIGVRRTPAKSESKQLRHVATWALLTLLAAGGVAFAPQATLKLTLGLVLAGSGLTLLGQSIALMPRVYAGILSLSILFMSGAVFAWWVWQRELHDAYQLAAQERDPFDWMLLVSPLYLGAIWWVTLRGWGRSRRV